MKRILFLFLALCTGFLALAQEPAWRARWISKSQSNSGSNEWIAFRKRVKLDKVPQRLPARIAADTKYWLWINGELAVYEGGLKRGPAPGDGYVDTVDIAPWLRPGENLISILVWHLGRNGFSHLDSGMAALLFEAIGDGVEILSDKTWEASVHHGYQTAPGPKPNYRLPESNVRFDARAYPFDWYLGKNPKWLGSAMELGFAPGQPPLGALVERPIPLWKTYGRRPYEQTEMVDGTLVCTLPYNGHFSPFLKVKAPAGKVIGIHTDHLTVGTEQCVRAEYVTREGVQEYEHFCWMNGEKMFYHIPEGVEVLEVGYRETSYNTEFTGSFSCDDPFLNTYWQKSARTLMVCMRDTYYDCPDRERAQWWGDEVNELGMAFYALSPSSWALARKGIYELVNWQKPDGSLHAPVPAGNYVSELPMQMLASVGWYGFHQYYWYSGDSTFVAPVYDRVGRYLLETWQLDKDGMPLYRKGDWDWPDAGKNQDRYAQAVLWYYLALKGQLAFAHMLYRPSDVVLLEDMMENIARRFNATCWDGTGYRTPGHEGPYDDRVQALAVVSGIAGKDKFPALKEIFAREYHATVYMQKYVLEALFLMGEADMALQRMHKLYPTVMKDTCSTLWEHWNFDGSSNHAWTGAGIIVLGGKVAGLEPTAPGWRRFRVAPQMGSLKQVSCTVDTGFGPISVQLDRRGKRIRAILTVPTGTTAEVPLPNGKTAFLTAGTHTLTL